MVNVIERVHSSVAPNSQIIISSDSKIWNTETAHTHTYSLVRSKHKQTNQRMNEHSPREPNDKVDFALGQNTKTKTNRRKPPEKRGESFVGTFSVCVRFLAIKSKYQENKLTKQLFQLIRTMRCQD